jgi:hypothetical protein
MAEVTISGLDPELLKRLEEIERSIPEVHTIEDLRRLAHESQERQRGRIYPDSTDLIREDRER